MNLKTRFLILGIIFLGFLFSAPTIVAFAFGYRIDWQARQLVETGTLMVRSLPKGASVFLNGEKQNAVTPAILRFLRPGEYELKLVKENYLPWTKRFTILAGRVSVASPGNTEVALFLEAPTMEKLDENVKGMTYAPSRLWWWSASSTLMLAGYGDDKKIKINLNAPDQVLITDDEQWAAFQQQQSLVIANLKTGKTFPINGFEGALKTIYTTGNNLTLLSGSGTVYRYSLSTSRLAIWKKGIIDLAYIKNQFYWLSKDELGVSAQDENGYQVVAALPAFKTGSITASGQGQIFCLLDGTVYIIGEQKLQAVAAGIEKIHWNEQYPALLLESANDLWALFTQRKSQPELLLRSDSPPAAAQLNFKTNRAYYLDSGRVKAVEVNAEINRTTIAFTPLSNVIDFKLDKAGEYLYLLTDEEKLYRAKIR